MYTEPAKCLQTRPKKVALVCLGPSYYDFVREAIGRQGARGIFDEVWTVNRGIFAFKHDKAFIMDDLRWLEQHDAQYANDIRQHDHPFITSTVYDDYPMAVAYPLQEVLTKIGDDIFNNTVGYAVAYAMTTGVRHLALYGADFYYRDVAQREEGAQAVCYLLGMSRAFGMQFSLPHSTSLLGAFDVRMDPKSGRTFRKLYGYHRQQQIAAPMPHPFVSYAQGQGFADENFTLEGSLANGPGFAAGQAQASAGNQDDAGNLPQTVHPSLSPRGAAGISPAGEDLGRGGRPDSGEPATRMVPRRVVEGPEDPIGASPMAGVGPEKGSGDSQYPAPEIPAGGDGSGKQFGN